MSKTRRQRKRRIQILRARAAKGEAPVFDEKDDDTLAGSLPADKDSEAAMLGMPVERLKLLSNVGGIDNILKGAIRRSQGLERKRR